MPNVDPVGIEGMKGKIRTYLSEIDVNDISRKSHNKILFDLASLFRSARTIQHKKILVR